MWYLICVEATSGLLHPVVIGDLTSPRFMAGKELIPLQSENAAAIRAIHKMGGETVIAAVRREEFLSLRDKLLDYVGRIRGHVDGMAAIAAAMGDLGIEIPRSSIEGLVATSVAERRALPGYALTKDGVIVEVQDDILSSMDDDFFGDEEFIDDDDDDEDLEDLERDLPKV